MNSILNSTTVFVINLKKDIEKKEHMLKLCKAFSLNCNFFEAIYGKSLSTEKINRHYAKKKAVKYSNGGLNLGEIGCLLSHKHIYQTMVNEEIEQTLILEDDIEFSNDIEKVFDNINSFPDNWEVILLGHHSHAGRNIETKANIWWNQYISRKYTLIRPSENGYGTYGYLINNKGAKKLLNTLDQYYKPIDHYTGKDKEVNVYAISPAPINIHTYMSDNHHSMDDRTDTQNKIVANNKAKKISLKNQLRSLGIFEHIVSLRDYLKMILPLRKYK